MRLRHRAFSYVGVHYSSFIALWINLHIGYSERKPSRISGCRFLVKTVSFSYVKLAVKQGRNLAFFPLVEVALKGENFLLVKCTGKPGKRFGI